jgi:hypothetical protein
MRSSVLLVTAVLGFAAGCDQQGPMVYVLESPQDVTLTASVSATKVKLGESVTVHVKRRAVGKWKQIPRDQLTPGQCWLYRPPPQGEEEVADNVQWEVSPQDAVRFNTEFRMDHTRIATLMRSGEVTLTPYTGVACEKDRMVAGRAIRIEVT